MRKSPSCSTLAVMQVIVTHSVLLPGGRAGVRRRRANGIAKPAMARSAAPSGTASVAAPRVCRAKRNPTGLVEHLPWLEKDSAISTWLFFTLSFPHRKNTAPFRSLSDSYTCTRLQQLSRKA